MTTFEKFNQLLLPYQIIIGYQPLKDEVDYKKISLFQAISNKTILLPKDKKADPFYLAKLYQKKYSNLKVCIFVPGQKFDHYGTRIGRGLGWYDRFLFKVPTPWLRIGIAHSSQLSPIRLPRQNWDEPVDWLMIKNNSVFNYYQTKAR